MCVGLFISGFHGVRPLSWSGPSFAGYYILNEPAILPRATELYRRFHLYSEPIYLYIFLHIVRTERLIPWNQFVLK
ncbi:uncharacterized protein F5147DRAFT_611623 [Suillus discolor]|uniref:Uncharacterized protein n=1 Tax=Suillus discolor TaxID=1912936 RepID=A0A9P7JUS1_9AGAM|nr:uncharacterized protein F5147DRAFT_611623 [Suillus discolor]KAG2109557.1 hypothetical protein F5147DRAFT_611623 [Suillus discolor]